MPAVPDHTQLFHALPDPCLVLTADLVMCEANRAYLEMTGRTLDDIRGRRVAEVFPVNPEDAGAADRLAEGYHRVLATRETAHLGVVRYDFPAADGEGFEARYWTLTVVPVLDEAGRVAFLLHRSREVTATHEHLLRALELSRAHTRGAHGHGDADPGPEVDEVLEIAVTALETTELAATLAAELGELRHALDTRSVIEQAKGILMAAHQVGPDEAFAMLRTRSQHTNTKLHRVALEFVAEAAGLVPEPEVEDQRLVP